MPLARQYFINNKGTKGQRITNELPKNLHIASEESKESSIS
jgi:hypothetical protein